MAQIPKFIDVTRTFVPVDPRAFPESLHTSGREESPEDRIPVMAYQGHNFLPTSYGYKSYFGVNETLDIDPLTAKVDAVFIYQNDFLENILIALTDRGIFTKIGSASGAWLNPVALPEPPTDVHYEWTYVVIREILYAYQQNGASYYTLTNDETLGVTVATVTPNFLNMAAQMGIFRAAGRLAFWDSDNSISHSNIDDFTDFEPSIETLAGNVKFSDIQGRIVTILPHGPGFIIYSTKSILYVAEDPANTFQWNPTVILSATGVSYPRNVAVASPDTTHFAMTMVGLKKITKAQEETIVPEVTDYLTSQTYPSYLKVMQDRYLFLENLDPTSGAGISQRGISVVPPTDYVFSGAQYALGEYEIGEEPGGACYLWDAISNGDFADMQPIVPEDAHPTSPNLRPVWTCFLSRNGAPDPDAIAWSAGVCPTVGPNGVEVNMSPSGKTTGDLSTDATGKVAVTGAEAYVDGIWTMERFMQTQEAIWKAENDQRQAYLTAITNRARTNTLLTYSNTIPAIGTTTAECTLGRYVSEFSSAKFGYSTCSFWLTRFAIAAMDLVRVKSNVSSYTDRLTTPAPFLGYSRSANAGPYYPSEAALVAAVQASYPGSSVALSFDYGFYWDLAQGETEIKSGHRKNMRVDPNGPYTLYVWEVWGGVSGYTVSVSFPSGGTLYTQIVPTGGRYEKTETMYAYNKGVDKDIAPIPETAYCEITGWTYTKADNTEGTIAAASCSSPTINPVGSPIRQVPLGNTNNPGINEEDGSICGQPFEGAVVPGEVVEWPTETLTIPEGSFLFREGSYAPLYPTIESTLVYDLHLKKWGKMKQRYKLLLDYSPINSTSSGLVPVEVFGIEGGILAIGGAIKLFDRFPMDSYISYGKVGYYRDGNTTPEEVRVDFRTLCTGYLKVETSLDGHYLANEFVRTKQFSSASTVTLYGAYPGRWSNIEIGGIFDINYLEYRGFKQGRR